ncbi:NAD-dependent dehydratase [Pollutimonas subterranea]|uniref:NAD-dependent dehydratase n=1 Tax=Pollutimonas subterranea TaxID=2045210 RepID=A0A2N4TZ07_9BURK|nr:UDP-glucuronic acid decarboxylase family protein [Pollutimonas subterranea]PLC48005.1 NAD-dependent dehydratase [Pollutimonas subterranea]
MNSVQASRERVLVAGGAGFLGSHLCRRLLDEGHHVICLDSFLTGTRRNISSMTDHPNFLVLRHDVISPLTFDIRPTQIYNLACPASPQHYQADPVHTLRTCVNGAFNLLEFARKTGARILQASTSEVYGDPHVHPQPEGYRGNVNIVGIRSCYDEGKRCAETLFSDYGRCKRVQVKIARIFNTYGPCMAKGDGRVVSNFIVQALNGSSMTVYGDGSQTRALCYVDDMIEGLMRLMNSVDTFQGPVNLGSPRESTVLDIACRIRRLVGTDSPIEFEPLPSDDPVQRCPDILLARRHLGWEPKIDLDTGLRKTIAHFSESFKLAESDREFSENLRADCKVSSG